MIESSRLDAAYFGVVDAAKVRSCCGTKVPPERAADFARAAGIAEAVGASSQLGTWLGWAEATPAEAIEYVRKFD